MTKISATTVSDSSGKQYHIGCKPGDLAERILLVGDPERAEKVARRLTDIRHRGSHREYVSITGRYKGLELSVLATGIGHDNTEIAVIETCQITKQPTFIRCGSCSSLQKEPKLGELIISRGAVRMDNTASYFVTDGYPAVADVEVQLALGMGCRASGTPYYFGITASAPGFYGAQGREVPGFPIRNPKLPDDLSRMNVMNFEMETSTLLVLSSLRGLRAGAVCTVFGNRPRDEFADEKLRLKGEGAAIDAALEAFRALDHLDQEKAKRKLSVWLPEWA